MQRISALMCAATLVVACGVSPGPGQVVDGFPIAEPVTLGSNRDEMQALAREALDHREPGHPGIARTQTFAEDLGNPTIFPEGRATRSGTVTVCVCTFVDGSYSATGGLLRSSGYQLLRRAKVAWPVDTPER